jgi:hypothetical protein
MKKIFISALIMLGMCSYSFGQQTQTTTTTKSKRHTHKKSHMKASDNAQANTTTKTLDDGTTGTMGKDTVKMSKKGQARNLNANTGTPLPPNSGNGK